MMLFKKIEDLQDQLRKIRAKGQTIGFVPTMGALHQGHISLIGASERQNHFSVCSIFVNPTQFNDPGDFKKYPVTIDRDILLLEKSGTGILFLPSVSEIYPDGQASETHYELGALEKVLEGQYRPGHFQGVCQVVERLLRIVQPDELFLGRKDYQQCMVIAKMIELQQLGVKVQICETLRESNGLAMSSRNMRLSEAEREKAGLISQTLAWMKTVLQPGRIPAICDEARQKLESAGFRVDYIEITTEQLENAENWDGRSPLVGLAAAFLGEVRLIDNMPFHQ